MRSTTLPAGFTVRLDPRVIRADRGRTLFGGTPARLVYLKPAAERLVAGTDTITVDGPVSAAFARLLLDRGLAHPVVEPVAATADQVTVVVPVRDRPAGLDRMLDALHADVRIIVVDDGSADEVATKEVAERHRARLIRHDQSAGPAAARNTGLAAVTTAYVAFVDSDVVPTPGWLATLLPHFTDPAVGAVAPRVVALDAPHATGWLGAYEAVRSSLDLGGNPALVQPRGAVAYLPTACLLARVAALREVGSFDASMPVAEDVDLVWRLGAAGWRVRYEPAARVAHEHRVELDQWLTRKAFYGTGAAPLALRHGLAVAPVVAAPWTAAVTVALLAQRRWSVPVAAGITAAAVLRLSTRLHGSDHPLRAAVQLAPFGITSAVWQAGAAMTRHWWPVAAAACVVSRRARRAVLVAAVADGVLDWRRRKPPLDPVRYIVAHRLDDLAYGYGLWKGAVQHRTIKHLLPDLTTHRT